MTEECCVPRCRQPIDLDCGERGAWCADHRWRPEKAWREGMRSVYPATLLVPPTGWAAREDARRRQGILPFDEGDDDD